MIAKSAKDSKAPASKSKAAAKPTAKAVVKTAKPVAKTVKPAAKPVAKAKTVAKPVAKTSAVTKKAVAKPAAKTVKPAAKPVAKTPTKAPAKAVKKVAAKVVAKPAVKVKPSVIPVAKPVVKPPVKPTPTATAAKEKKPMSVSPSVTKVSPAPAVPTAVAAPAKAGRPSSRLAQLTVPSIAQSVASTAAKASYSQSEPSAALIVPVLPSSIKKDPKLANNWKTKPVAELTDAELMAMPDSEYMNEVQMAAFRLKLANLKRDILSNAGETTEHLREDTSVVPDPADRATIEEEHALELRTRDRERKLLKKIEQSITRIDAGDYGYCDETGEAIGVGRLLARPTATLSLEAQQRRELKQKMFGD